jgi:hypothetical protein
MEKLIKALMNPRMVFGWLDLRNRMLKLSGIIALNVLKTGKILKLPLSIRALVTTHLMRIGEPNHPNAEAFITVLEMFHGAPLHIIETGTSAWGADSTRLWDEYVQYCGGQLQSVDLRPEPSVSLRGKLSNQTELSVGDSVVFLEELARKDQSADLIYLDSFDVDWDDPEPAEIHGEAEFKIAMNLIRVGGIILIDDTPTPSAAKILGITLQDVDRTRGKGGRVLQAIQNNPDFSVIFHEYAVAIKRTN